MWLKNYRPSVLGFALINAKLTSNTKLKRYTEIGSTCVVHLSIVRYSIALPSSIIHDSGLIIHNSQVFFKTHKEWFIESNAFSISTVIKSPSISNELVISRTSDTSLQPSLINLLLTYTTWCSVTMVELTFFKWQESASETNLISTFKREIGLQFCVNLLSLLFLSINFIIVYFCEALNSPTKRDCCIRAQIDSIRKFQILLNFFCSTVIPWHFIIIHGN